MKIKSIFFIITFCILTRVHANDDLKPEQLVKNIDKKKLTLIEEYFTILGMNDFLAQRLTDGTKDLQVILSKHYPKEKISKAVKDAFEEQRKGFADMQLVVIDEFLTKDDLRKTIAFFKSSTGQKYLSFSRSELINQSKYKDMLMKMAKSFATNVMDKIKANNE